MSINPSSGGSGRLVIEATQLKVEIISADTATSLVSVITRQVSPNSRAETLQSDQDPLYDVYKGIKVSALVCAGWLSPAEGYDR